MLSSVLFSILYIVIFFQAKKTAYQNCGGPEKPSCANLSFREVLLLVSDNILVALALIVVATSAVEKPLSGLAIATVFGLLFGGVNGMFKAQRELSKLEQRSTS